MIELTVKNFLKEKLDPVEVHMEVPADPPEKYVLIEKTGSGIRNHIKSATIVIQSVAGSMYDAMVLNESVKESMDQLIILPEICRSELNSDYNFTDTRTKKYRYQAVYELVHY